MQILLAWLILASGIVLDAYSDSYLDKNKKRNHSAKAICTAFYFISGMLFGMFISYTTFLTTLFGAGIVFSIVILLRLGIFNISYNFFIGQPTEHVGTTSEIDEILDKLPNLLVIIIYWLSTLSSMILSGFLYALW